MAAALIVIALTQPPPFHAHTCTPLSDIFSYQHAVPIKSCAFNLIKPHIYIKQPISPSTPVCISQGAQLPQGCDFYCTHNSPGPQLPHPIILPLFFFVNPVICSQKPQQHILFFSLLLVSILLLCLPAALVVTFLLPFFLAGSQQSVVRHQY